MAKTFSSIQKPPLMQSFTRPSGNINAPRNMALNNAMTSTPSAIIKPPLYSTPRATQSPSNTNRGTYGTITSIGGGKVYSDPRDNPNFRASATSPATTPPPQTPPTSPIMSSQPPSPVSTPTGSNGQNLGLYGQYVNRLAGFSSQPSRAYQDASKNYNDINSQLEQTKEQEANTVANELSRKGIPLGIGQGRAQQVQNAYLQKEAALGQELNAASNVLGQANTQQSLQQSALGTATGYAAPQQYGLTTQPYNPVTDTFGGGGAGGAINRAVQASNIGSAQDFQAKIQSTQAQANAADANFSVLNDYASKAGLDQNSPIISGIQQKISEKLLGNDALAGFQSQLQAVRQAWASLIGGDANAAIPDEITPSQLKQKQQVLKTAVANNIAGYRNQLGSLSGGDSQSNQGTSGSTGGAGGQWSW